MVSKQAIDMYLNKYHNLTTLVVNYLHVFSLRLHVEERLETINNKVSILSKSFRCLGEIRIMCMFDKTHRQQLFFILFFCLKSCIIVFDTTFTYEQKITYRNLKKN